MSSSRLTVSRFAVSKIFRKPPRICAKAIFWSSVLPALTIAPYNSPRSRSGRVERQDIDFKKKEFQPRMNTNDTNIFSDRDDLYVLSPLLLFVNIGVHSWLKFFILRRHRRRTHTKENA